MIWEALKESLIFTEVDAAASDEVMKQVGGALVKEGYCKESFVDALIQRESEFPTGLNVNGVGVAIPHTDVSHVNQAGVAIAILKQPVGFIQMGSDDEPVDVRLIFMLAVVDPNQHLEELQRILSIIQDQEVLKRLLTIDHKKQVIEIIQEKENLL